MKTFVNIVSAYAGLQNGKQNAVSWQKAADDVRLVFRDSIIPHLLSNGSSSTKDDFVRLSEMTFLQRVLFYDALLVRASMGKMKLTKHQRSAILGSMYVESGFDPLACERTTPFKISVPKVLSAPALGLVQHTGNRCITLLAHNLSRLTSGSNVIDTLDPTSSMIHIVNEIAGTMKDNWEHKNLVSHGFFASDKINNLKHLNFVFTRKFERPAPENTPEARLPFCEDVLTILTRADVA